MTLWVMLAAPLLAGNDPRDMTSETKEILLNREVLAMDEDYVTRPKLPTMTAYKDSTSFRA